ncbi:protein of unknown function (plasmid) [Methylocella tundrae]|uniref:Uncharacterized protein n=1 Tax=Methylocella tundrae TaxID=227605 RepID=A0A4U8Z6N1_METTU|nr:protein of unknown function [Methylocella tundrae]
MKFLLVPTVHYSLAAAKPLKRDLGTNPERSAFKGRCRA